MRSTRHFLVASAALALVPASVAADETFLPFAIHDILITSNIPIVNIGVRNISSSTDPADRDLRVVSSDADGISVSGQVWCKDSDSAQAYATKAQVQYGAILVHNNQIFGVTNHSPSAIQHFQGEDAIENYQIDAPLSVPNQGDNSPIASFNPVNVVEDRLEHFVEQGAGTAADFLRVDDVFEAEVRLNAIGWCQYSSQSINGEYVGFRAAPVEVHIFYHGDPDIKDPITAMDTPGTLTAPAAPRARFKAKPRRATTEPPARDDTPARSTEPSRDSSD